MSQRGRPRYKTSDRKTPADVPATRLAGEFRGIAIIDPNSLMPTQAQTHLLMGPDLEHILRSVLIPEYRQFTYEALGSIGEQLILNAEQNSGRRVRHVSLLSDTYGYDLESVAGNEMQCIEVKCTVQTRAGRFFLTRNEYEQSRRLRRDWILVQVVLRSDMIWTASYLNATCIAAIHWLSSDTIFREIVKDNTNCAWEDTVQFKVPDNMWQEYENRLECVLMRIPNPLVPPNHYIST